MMYADADVRMGEEAVSQMQTKADKGEEGVKSYQIFVGFLCGQPYSGEMVTRLRTNWINVC